MPRVFVTGATGFIGTRLVERLVERGDRVACLVQGTSQVRHLEQLGVDLVVGSLDDEASLKAAIRDAFGSHDVEVIYHLAGQTHGSRLNEMMRVNAGGTERLCAAAVRAELTDPPVVVVVSSLSAAGPSPPEVPHTEAVLPKPISNYGRTKLAGEQAARRYANQLWLSIVRPSVVFGPGDRDGLLLFKSLRWFPLHVVPQRKGLPLSLVYVDDLVEALIAVGERGERIPSDAQRNDPTGLYYIAAPQVSSYAQVGRMVAAALGKRIFVVCRRKYALLPLAIAGDLIGRIRRKKLLFGRDKLREASASGWVCSSAKITEQLEWRPSATLADRYLQTEAWYREHGWL